MPVFRGTSISTNRSPTSYSRIPNTAAGTPGWDTNGNGNGNGNGGVQMQTFQYTSQPTYNSQPQPTPTPSKPIHTSSTLRLPWVTKDYTAGYPLERYPFRALVGLITAIGVLASYIAIGILYLDVPSSHPDSFIRVGKDGAKWIFYGWFVIATIGINLSRYSLQGAEATLLMDPRWAASNATRLLMHCDVSWSGPGGWFRTLRKTWHLGGGLMEFAGLGRSTLKKRNQVMPSQLWWILAFLSALVFIALPGSGLTMELGDGYNMKEGYHPPVTGRDYWSFNQRLWETVEERTREMWRIGTPARLPGIGIIYAAPEVERGEFDFLNELPGTLPITDGAPDIFLTAQAAEPIQGQSWGLRLQYNCSVVTSRKELTILDPHIQRDNHTDFLRHINRLGAYERRDIGTSSVFTAGYAHAKGNTEPAFFQMGISDFENFDFTTDWSSNNTERMRPNQYRYFETKLNRAKNGDRNGPFMVKYQELHKPHHLELVLYRPYTNTSQPLSSYGGIEDLHGLYHTTYNDLYHTLTPIGIRCTSTSTPGVATLSSQTSTFTHFTHTSTPPFNFLTPLLPAVPNPGVLPLSLTPASILRHDRAPITTLLTSIGTGTEHFSLTPSMPSAPLSLPSFPTASQLRSALLSLYALSATNLVFDGAQALDPSRAMTGASRREMVEREVDLESGWTESRYFHTFVNGNVTGSVRGRVLIRGVVPWGAVAGLLGVWALGVMVVVGVGGFGRRWSEMLDGFSMMRFGADFSDEILAKKDFSDTRGYEYCESLKDLPGLVGDGRPEFSTGRIGLVRREGWRRIPEGRVFGPA